MFVKVLESIFGETLSSSISNFYHSFILLFHVFIRICSSHSLSNNIFSSLSLDINHVICSIRRITLHMLGTFVKNLMQVRPHGIFGKSL
jgi:hypothetical protein